MNIAVLETPARRSSSKPLRPGRYKVELTAGQELHDKLEQLKQLLRHQVPDGDLSVIVERAVDVLLEQTLKRRCARSSKPRKRRTVARKRSRDIPRAVVREVHERDAGQCTFVSRDGKRCGERGFLELHLFRSREVVPYAREPPASLPRPQRPVRGTPLRPSLHACQKAKRLVPGTSHMRGLGSGAPQ